MRPWLEAAGYWLADYYTLATAVLVMAAAGLASLGQPARRLRVAGAAVCGLGALTFLVALPGWPRTGWPGLRLAPRSAALAAAPVTVAPDPGGAAWAPALGIQSPSATP